MKQQQPSPEELEHRTTRSFLHFAVVIGTAVVAALLVIVIHVQLVTDREANNLEGHRQRNEIQHDCLIRKYDTLRTDIYNLLQTPPGEKPRFPAFDHIECPPLKP